MKHSFLVWFCFVFLACRPALEGVHFSEPSESLSRPGSGAGANCLFHYLRKASPERGPVNVKIMFTASARICNLRVLPVRVVTGPRRALTHNRGAFAWNDPGGMGRWGWESMFPSFSDGVAENRDVPLLPAVPHLIVPAHPALNGILRLT